MKKKDKKTENNQKLCDLRQLARKAKEDGDIEAATKYYEQVAQEDPTDWESRFYSAYFAAHQIKLLEIADGCSQITIITMSLPVRGTEKHLIVSAAAKVKGSVRSICPSVS